jgi:phenylpropionate dioxygenase-like ring-hydroxylating dioxygenase large terminal subunit
VVNGPYTILEDETISVWFDFQQEQGQIAIKPADAQKPDAPWQLCFKFPNIWMLRPTKKVLLTLAFAPIDDENTMMYIRSYHNLSKNLVVGQIISKISTFFNAKILSEDEAVVMTQTPKQGGLDSGDKYIPADRPILLYHTHRDELIRAAEREQPDDTRLPALSI